MAMNVLFSVFPLLEVSRNTYLSKRIMKSQLIQVLIIQCHFTVALHSDFKPCRCMLAPLSGHK